MTPSLLQRVTAEAIGTFALVFVGVLSINVGVLSGSAEDPASLLTVALAHGLTIAVMVAALGAVSGAHFNPAVTAGFVSTGRMKPTTGLAYWGAQLLGALLAAGILGWTFGQAPVAAGTPALAATVSGTQAIVLEAVATFFLVLVIFGSAVDERAPAGVFPLAIGLTVTLDILAIGPLTGAALNPARALGPALISGQWNNHAVFWIGPILGGVVAAWVMHGFLMRTGDQEPG